MLSTSKAFAKQRKKEALHRLAYALVDEAYKRGYKARGKSIKKGKDNGKH